MLLNAKQWGVIARNRYNISGYQPTEEQERLTKPTASFQAHRGRGVSLYREAQMNKFDHALKGGIVSGNTHMKNTLPPQNLWADTQIRLKTLPSNKLTKRMTNMDARDNKRLSTKYGCLKLCLLFQDFFHSKLNTKTCCLLSEM